MNGQDRKDIDGLKAEVKGLAINIEELSKSEDNLYAYYNDLAGSVDEIMTNHLPHISNDAKSAKFRSGVTMWVSGITIAFLTIGIAIIACLIALN